MESSELGARRGSQLDAEVPYRGMEKGRAWTAVPKPSTSRSSKSEVMILSELIVNHFRYKPWGMTGFVFFGHEFHITEILLLFFVIMAIICTFLALTSAGIPGIFYACMLLITSTISMVMALELPHWRVADDTLAKLAARYARAAELYEELNEELKEENDKMSEQNDAFKKANTELKGTVDGLWKDVGIVDTATADLDKILKGFDALMETSELMEKYEKELNEDQQKFLDYQRQKLLTDKKHHIKRKLREIFDDVDTDQSGEIKGRETKALQRVLKREMPAVKEVEKAFDMDGDGVIKKWELLDSLDVLLDKVYTRDYEKKTGLELKT
eukprot:1089046-Amorphochlora_amoeboformis.AAC.1